MTVQDVAVAAVPTWTFGDRLRKARSVTGMDQRGFAAALGIKPGALAQWETDRARPRDIIGMARRVQDFTGVAATWLLGFDQPSGVCDNYPLAA